MSWKMAIAATSEGMPLIGADACRRDTVARDYVYPSQFAFRVTARDGDGQVHICTRTTAALMGWEVLYAFPCSDGSRSVRRR